MSRYEGKDLIKLSLVKSTVAKYCETKDKKTHARAVFCWENVFPTRVQALLRTTDYTYK